MTNTYICSCCGQELDSASQHPVWSVVTAQVEDGHPNDTYFVTSDADLVNQYARAVQPYKIYQSKYASCSEAEEFADNYLSGYDEIDPSTIIFAVNAQIARGLKLL
jgi:hypothetical protein